MKAGSPNSFILDVWFWIAMGAAPVVWVGLSLLLPQLGVQIEQTLDMSGKWQALLMVALVYPVLEEIVFRGALQGYLLEHQVFAKRLLQTRYLILTRANVLTTFVFTALHFLNHPPLWAALVFFPSLVFGCCRDRYGNIWPCILLHCFYNGGFFLLFG